MPAPLTLNIVLHVFVACWPDGTMPCGGGGMKWPSAMRGMCVRGKWEGRGGGASNGHGYVVQLLNRRWG